MGLDITAHRNLQAVRPLTDEEIEWGGIKDDDSNLVTIWHFNDDFPDHAEGLKEKTVYTADESFDFSAGSYGGYNDWRDELAKMAGHPSAKHAWANGADGKPFWELIHFSDCEGVIGPRISAKLAKDFAANQTKADAVEYGEGYFQDKYTDWRRAFEMAADNGAVEFH